MLKDGKRYLMNTAEFIRRSKELHGDAYGYEEAVYVTQQTKVKIYCNACQKFFEQHPRKHYAQGEGCWECGVKKRQKSQQLPFIEFVTRAEERHGVGTYSYLESTYAGVNAMVDIVHNACGHAFIQNGNAHMAGSGCPPCAAIRSRNKLNKSSHSLNEKV